MLNEDNIQKLVEDESKENSNELQLVAKDGNSLVQVEENLIQSIIEAPSKEALDKQFELFNLNQVKKNALRVVKLNNLLSKIEDQVVARFETRPDQASNRELLDYMDAVSKQIDRSQNFNKETLSTEVGGITRKNVTTEVNINVAPTINKANVVDAISSLLKQVQNSVSEETIEEAEFIQAEVVDSTNSESEIVYNESDETKETEI